MGLRNKHGLMKNICVAKPALTNENFIDGTRDYDKIYDSSEIPISGYSGMLGGF